MQVYVPIPRIDRSFDPSSTLAPKVSKTERRRFDESAIRAKMLKSLSERNFFKQKSSTQLMKGKESMDSLESRKIESEQEDSSRPTGPDSKTGNHIEAAQDPLTIKMAEKLNVAKINEKYEGKRAKSQFIRRVKVEDMIEHLS